MCNYFRLSNSTAISVNKSAEEDPFQLLHPFRPVLKYVWFSEYLLYIFGSLHLFFSLWMLLEYFIINWPNFSLPRILYTNKLLSTIRRLVLTHNYAHT